MVIESYGVECTVLVREWREVVACKISGEWLSVVASVLVWVLAEVRVGSCVALQVTSGTNVYYEGIVMVTMRHVAYKI